MATCHTGNRILQTPFHHNTAPPDLLKSANFGPICGPAITPTALVLARFFSSPDGAGRQDGQSIERYEGQDLDVTRDGARRPTNEPMGWLLFSPCRGSPGWFRYRDLQVQGPPERRSMELFLELSMLCQLELPKKTWFHGPFQGTGSLLICGPSTSGPIFIDHMSQAV